MTYFFLTLTIFLLFLKLQQKSKLAILNPVLLSVVAIILILHFFDIPYTDYMVGGSFITLFLGPATVALALPLYRNWHILKERGIVLVAGIVVGTLVAISSVWIMCKLLKVDREIVLSLLPKSITTPIGMEVSRTIGGVPSLTVSVIVVTGIVGNILGPIIFKIFKINDPVAVGAAFGTASHAIGTSKALEIGEIEGAISGLSIGLAGLLTSIIIPIFLLIFA